MDIVESADNGDVTLEKDGVNVYLDKEANKMLSGSTIDFSTERGFIISGMQQTSCCS